MDERYEREGLDPRDPADDVPTEVLGADEPVAGEPTQVLPVVEGPPPTGPLPVVEPAVERERELVSEDDPSGRELAAREYNSAMYWILGAIVLGLALLIGFMLLDDDDKDRDSKRNTPAVVDNSGPATDPAGKPDTTTPDTQQPDSQAPDTQTPDTQTDPQTNDPSTQMPTDQPDPQTQPQDSTTFAELASDPEAQRGKQIASQAPAQEMVNDIAFVAEADGARALVVTASGPESFPQGTEFSFKGTGDVVDQAFRDRVGPDFFRDMSYEDLQGLLVFDQATVKQV
jgi:hypothetical protein